MNSRAFTNLVLGRLRVVSRGFGPRETLCPPTNSNGHRLLYPSLWRPPSRSCPATTAVLQGRPWPDPRPKSTPRHPYGSGRYMPPFRRPPRRLPRREAAPASRKRKQFSRFAGTDPDRGPGTRHRRFSWEQRAIGPWRCSSLRRRNPRLDTWTPGARPLAPNRWGVPARRSSGFRSSPNGIEVPFTAIREERYYDSRFVLLRKPMGNLQRAHQRGAGRVPHQKALVLKKPLRRVPAGF